MYWVINQAARNLICYELLQLTMPIELLILPDLLEETTMIAAIPYFQYMDGISLALMYQHEGIKGRPMCLYRSLIHTMFLFVNVTRSTLYFLNV